MTKAKAFTNSSKVYYKLYKSFKDLWYLPTSWTNHPPPFLLDIFRLCLIEVLHRPFGSSNVHNAIQPNGLESQFTNHYEKCQVLSPSLTSCCGFPHFYSRNWITRLVVLREVENNQLSSLWSWNKAIAVSLLSELVPVFCGNSKSEAEQYLSNNLHTQLEVWNMAITSFVVQDVH